MAKIARKDVKIFASTAGATGVTEFKTTSQTTPTYSTNPDIIQNTAWEDGWLSGSNVIPYAEDMNAVQYVTSYHLAYLMQQGIPEWSANTVYYTGSFCQVSGDIYKCLNDNISGTIPTSDTTNWVKLDTTPVTAVNLGSGEGLFYQKNANGQLEMKGLAVIGGTISSTDTTVIIDFSGGGGISTVWGTIGGTVTDQTDLVNYISGLLANTYQNSASAVPATNNTYNLGSSTYKFLNGYISTINTDALKSANAAINIYNNLLPSATGTYDLGSSSYTYKTGYIDTLYTKTLTSVNAQIDLGIDLIPSNNNAYKLGSSANAFSNGYFKALTLNGNDLATTLSSYVVSSSNNSWTGTNTFDNNIYLNWNYDAYLYHVQFMNTKDSMVITNVTNNTLKFNSPTRHSFYINNTEVFSIESNNIAVKQKLTTKAIEPDLSNTYDIGATGNYFNTAWIVKTKSDIIEGITDGRVVRVGLGEFNQITNNSFVVKAYKDTDNLIFGSANSTGGIQIYNSAGNGYWTGTAWASSSDEKLKKNIETNEEKAIDKINQLRVVNFNWKKEGDNDDKHTGFIANEVEKVIPGAVMRAKIPDNSSSEQEETLLLDKMEFIPYLVKAIQELSAKVDELERQLY